ncbi:alkaline phosphatase family protein [Gordoniibacillus kamchatkensis]|uniref:alkaline phosphatase family protein n=1 Tax=Gordoniibacillus kamchatkensis TaxID=1590651 RepID=UPI001E295E4A|nr:alkaline phosphatase family protein [Paenibacillus sp. VKM B-2647]
MSHSSAWCSALAAVTLALAVLGGCSAAGGVPSQDGASQTAEQPPAVPSKSPGVEPPAVQTPASPAPTAPAAPATGTVPAPTPAPVTAPAKQPSAPAATGKLPTPDHIVIVIEENHSYEQIVGNPKAPYFNELIKEGALMTKSYAVAHPSQPNYLALFSGSTQGMTSDKCGETYASANLATELLDKKLSFAGYSEDMPKAGYTGCSSRGYARKHNPWVQFTNVPAELNQPLTSFPKNFSQLPAVSFVIPNHQDDMHDGTVEQADKWLKDNLGAYVDWAASHNSLLLVTWDEDDNSRNNHIPTFFVGPMVKPGQYDTTVNHYSVLRTIEEMYGLKPLGNSESQQPITSIWR